MAELYSARRSGANGFEKLLAIKRVRPDLQHDAQVVDMFLDEARVAALMNHPNIVQVYDLDTDGESTFMLMEHLHGHDLGALCSELFLRRQRMSVPQAVRIVVDVARALHYAHELRDGDGKPLGIVHGDVSPRNVFVTDQGRVKLVDFGVARGTLAYMAPEQIERREVDRRADAFSLGVILWELTVGRRLFSAVTDEQLARRALREAILRPSACVPRYPASLERVVMKALARDPRARYQTLAEMQRDLEQVVRCESVDRAMVDLAVLVQRHGAAMASPPIAPDVMSRIRRVQPSAARLSAFLVVMLAATAAFAVADAVVP